jgi:hypothetical protein
MQPYTRAHFFKNQILILTPRPQRDGSSGFFPSHFLTKIFYTKPIRATCPERRNQIRQKKWKNIVDTSVCLQWWGVSHRQERITCVLEAQIHLNNSVLSHRKHSVCSTKKDQLRKDSVYSEKYTISNLSEQNPELKYIYSGKARRKETTRKTKT